MKKNLAFSMVEVMITLVILGVIAVLTVPGLVDSANKRINDAAADKADYAVSQAAMRLQTECPRLRNCNNGDTVRNNLINLLNGANANDMLTYYVSNMVAATRKFYVFVTIKDDESFPILYEINDSGSGTRAAEATSADCSKRDSLGYNCVIPRANSATWSGININQLDGKTNVTGIRIERNCNAATNGNDYNENSCYP